MGVAVAEPVIEASGDSLPAFKLKVHVDRVDHGSPRGLAGSYAQLQRDQFQVRRHFQRIFQQAHLAVMRRHYGRALVVMQEEAYKKVLAVPAVTCTVDKVEETGDTATALLDWTFGPRRQRMRLGMRRTDGKWRVESVFVRRGQGRWTERKPQPPRTRRPTPLPPAVKTPATAKDTVRALYYDMRRIRQSSAIGYDALANRFASLLRAFSGEVTAKAAPPDDRGIQFEIGAAKPLARGVERVEMFVTEKVPGTDKRSAVHNTAFDVTKTEKGWRITAEYWRPKPDLAFVPTLQNFGLVFQA